MAFSFRHRIELHQPQSLPVSESELVLEDTGESRVVLVSRGQDTDISQTQHLALLGSGYESEVEAHRAGEGWRSILQRVFAANRVGADFGDRAPGGGLTTAGREAIEEKGRELGHEIQALYDKHGLIVFQSDPTPVFIGLSGTGFAPVSADRFTRALDAPASRTPTTSQERTAYDLFAASYRRSIGAEARLLLLMTAVEVLMDQRPRGTGAVEQVNELVRLTREAELPQDDKESIVGSLRHLTKESLRQAGRRLARTLGDRTYLSLEPEKFFDVCYDLRSRVVHGAIPFPTNEEVGRFAASLEVFVAHLLAGPEFLDQLDSE